MVFTYNGQYVNAVTTAKEGLSFKDERAIGHNVPGHLMKGYPREAVAPILRDIVPQGAGRRYLLRHWDITGDPGPSVDFKLFSEGCIAPIDNLYSATINLAGPYCLSKKSNSAPDCLTRIIVRLAAH